DHLCRLAGRSYASDPLIGRELEVAKELISEVFSVGSDEVRLMIKERMARKGMIRDRRRAAPEDKAEEKAKAEKKKVTKAEADKAKGSSRRKGKEALVEEESE